MTNSDFIDVGKLASELWPEFALNGTQAEVWWEKLQHYDRDIVLRAMREAYAIGRWKVPLLSDVIDASRRLKGPSVGVYHESNVSAEQVYKAIDEDLRIKREALK